MDCFTLFAMTKLRERRHAGGVGQHHGERFCFTVLAQAQPRHGVSIACITGQMKAAQALDGDDGATLQEVQGLRDRVAGDGLALYIRQIQARAALRATGGLGMKTPVGGRGVFSTAVRAQWERGHAGLWPIKRQGTRDGEARAAMGAGDEGMAITST